MAKTQSQTGDLTIKKEEEEDYKPALSLHNSNNTRISNKIAKRNAPKGNSRRLTDQHVKIEEDTDTKSLLQSSLKYPKLPKGRCISQEQINQFIDYVVNHGMSVTKASRMAKISQATGLRYYKEYKNDPEKKIPTPRSQLVHLRIFSTQQQIENLIKYISEDKMTIAKASAKASMPYISGYRYYKKYLKDPGHKIPISPSRQNYTQDQKNEMLGYIVNDKMTIKAASLKARMNVITAGKYYHEYFNAQNPDITAPSHIATCTRYTQDQKNEFIGYIVNDKMTIKEASKKARMNATTAGKYYHDYFNAPNPDITAPSHIATCTRYTQEQIKELIGYIINDKMTVNAASKKANMTPHAATIHYRRYLKDHNMEIPVSKFTKRYTQDEINQLVGYIVDDKMSMKAASEKANMNYVTGYKYYRRYLKKHNLEAPTRRCTQDQESELIGYIVDDKMSIGAASKKANMSWATGNKYYQKYLNDQKRGPLTHRLRLDSVTKNK